MGRAPHEGIGLERIVRDVKAELNPDGGGYHTSEAADLVFERARRGCGFLTAPMRELARAGAVVKLKEYANETAATNPRLSMARAAARKRGRPMRSPTCCNRSSTGIQTGQGGRDKRWERSLA